MSSVGRRRASLSLLLPLCETSAKTSTSGREGEATYDEREDLGQALWSFEDDVSVEERGGELDQGEGETRSLCESRLIAELENFLLDFDGEEGEREKWEWTSVRIRGCRGWEKEDEEEAQTELTQKRASRLPPSHLSSTIDLDSAPYQR